MRFPRYMGGVARAVIALGGLLPPLAKGLAQLTEEPAAVQAQVEAGKALFATACANCHGSAGRGAIGPALAARNLTWEVIRATVLNGRVGTPMPSFKHELDLHSQEAILAYVQWLTSDGHLPTAVVTIASGEDGAQTLSEQPVAVGPERGIPARGASVFFDPTKIDSCRTCHSFDGKGGPVGPDLISIAKTRLQVYQSITRPKIAAANFPAINIEMRDGTREFGIEAQETPDTTAFYDVSSLPPVKRTVRKSEISQVTAIKDSGIYDHTKLGFSKQELLDLSALIGK